MNTHALFVTGMQRSGTTLVEKLLGQHPDISMLSQPFPHVFIEAKAAFLRSRGYEDRYPLGPLIDEGRYRLVELTEFLQAYRPGLEQLTTLFEKMAGYSGQYTRFSTERLEDCLTAHDTSTLSELATALWRDLSDQPAAQVFGGKEVVCEEFLPYLLASGIHAVVVVRDPRDCLTSLNHGKGAEFGGSPKPTLFNLRQWRKSVAYALHLEDVPGLTWLRYEDLVDDPERELDQIASRLGLQPFDARWYREGIRGHHGRPWRGNSSHAHRLGVDGSSVGRFRQHLPPDVTMYTEAVCYPEMRALGYAAELPERQVADTIRSFREPYDIRRAGLRCYTELPANIETELARYEVLRGPPDPRRFLFENVQDRLREAVEA